jgi:hypothetical protein
MAGPKIPVLPPIGQAPFLNPQILTLTPASLALLQQIWTAAFGLGGITPGLLLLGYSDNINFNVAGDTQISLALPSGAIGWRASLAMVFGTQGSFNTARAGIYRDAFQQGTALAGQTALSGITGTGFVVSGATTDVLTPDTSVIWNYSTVYLNVGTPQGGTALGNFYFYGYPVF